MNKKVIKCTNPLDCAYTLLITRCDIHEDDLTKCFRYVIECNGYWKTLSHEVIDSYDKLPVEDKKKLLYECIDAQGKVIKDLHYQIFDMPF